MCTQKKQMTPANERNRIPLLKKPGRRIYSAQCMSGFILFLLFTLTLIFTGAAAADVTITFKADDGPTAAEYTQTIESSTATPLMLNKFDAPSSEQYFLKWADPDEEYFYADGQSIKLTQNLTLHAVWTAAEKVSSFPENEISSEGYYQITDNITLTSSLVVADGVVAVLDLNGYILSGDGTDSVIKLLMDKEHPNGCHLKLVDSAPAREHTPALTYLNPVTQETITVNGGCITGGKAKYGGGVYIIGECTFTMCGGNIVGNSATYDGGGMIIRAYIPKEAYTGTVTMSGGIIAGNEAPDGDGGGVENKGMFTMDGGKIVGNCARNGGGIGNSGGGVGNDGVFKITGGTISDNKAVKSGGGIYNLNIVSIQNGEIKSNCAKTGGGIYNGKSLSISGGCVIENSAENGSGVYSCDPGKSTFYVSGTATVKDNYDNNIHLSDSTEFVLSGDLTGTIMISKAKSTISGGAFGSADDNWRGAENIIYDNGETPLYGFINPDTTPYSLVWKGETPTTVTFMDGGSEYASIKCSRGSAFIFPEPPVKTGRTFSGWKDEEGNWFCIYSGGTGLFFTKSAYYNPDETWKYTQTALTLHAAWDEISPGEQHGILICSTEHGAISASYARAPAGTEILLTAFPAAGYKLKSWTVSGGVSVPSENPTRFIMPDSDVSVSAVFEAESPAPGPEPEEKEMTVSYQTGESTSYSIQIPAELELKKGQTKEAAISVNFTTPPGPGEYVAVTLTSADADPEERSRFLLKLEGDETRTVGYRIASDSSFESESLIKTGDRVLSATKDTTENLYFKLTEDAAFAGTYKGTVTFTATLERTQAEEASPAEDTVYPEEDVNPINKT